MAVSVLVEGERLRFNWDFGSERVVGSREIVLAEVQEGGVASILWLILNPPRVVEDQGSRRNIHAREKEKKV